MISSLSWLFLWLVYSISFNIYEMKIKEWFFSFVTVIIHFWDKPYQETSKLYWKLDSIRIKRFQDFLNSIGLILNSIKDHSAILGPPNFFRGIYIRHCHKLLLYAILKENVWSKLNLKNPIGPKFGPPNVFFKI